MKKEYNLVIFEDSDEDFFLIEHMFNSITKSKYILHRVQNLDDFGKIDPSDINLIIMDYHLNGASGLDFIESIKSQHGDLAPFIFLTGVDNPTLYDQLKQLSVFDYFIKSEMTISLLERTCFYAIERFEATNIYNKEREFSKYLIENLRYFVAEIDDNDKLIRSNESFKKFKQNVFLKSSTLEQDEFLAKLKTNDKKFNFEFKVNDKIVYTKWEKITSQFSVNYTYIGEDITEETNQKDLELSRRRLETLGHLAGGIAHELNNTLQPIILRNEMLLDIGHGLNNQDIIEHTTENKNMLSHGADIITDILAFSNSQSEEVESLDGDLVQIIKNAITMVQKSLPKDVRLTINIDDRIAQFHPPISANNMLKFLSNTIHNAALSMDMNGEVELDFSITTPTDADDHIMRISIKDHGTGMDKDILQNIFSPFFTTRAPGQGTGLGMSVVHSIIQNLNGDIEIDSHVGHGTTICAIIPVTPKEP